MAIDTTVLVVEDEPSMQILLKYTLRRAGFQVTLAINGAVARDMLGTQRFDVICSDVMMSGLDGMELCSWIKDQPELRDTPVVLLSSRAQQGDRDLGIEAGADVYMTKPFDVEELVTTLRRLSVAPAAGA